MPKFRNLICFLSHVFLVYTTTVYSVNGGGTGSGTQTGSLLNTMSCDASGTVHATKDIKVQSVLVECVHDEGDTIKAAVISVDDVTINGCPINKPVKIFVFDTAHDGTEGLVVKSSGYLKEIIVVCNGVHIKVQSDFTNGPFSPTAATSIPIANGLKIKVTESDGHTSVTNVDIDQTYKLKISSPANLHILVESCDAASNSQFTEHLVELYIDREPNAVYNVLGKFLGNSTSGMVSEMKGFRLLDSSDVYLRCFVDVCAQADCPSLTTTKSPTATLPPTTPTTHARRRRRNVDIHVPNRKVTLSTSFRVKSSFTTSRAKGYSAGDERYVVLASLLLAKTFFDRY